MCGIYGPFECACWLLEHDGEALVLEMPLPWEDEEAPWETVARFAAERGLNITAATVTHAHIDHAYGLPYFRLLLPEARFVALRATALTYGEGLFDLVFEEGPLELSVGGEPLILLDAPKHSWEDVLVFFRGWMCSGDWSLGPYPDCNSIVPTAVKIETMEKVLEFVRRRPYHVHTISSAHGNELRRNVDLPALLDEMIAYFSRRSLGGEEQV